MLKVCRCRHVIVQQLVLLVKYVCTYVFEGNMVTNDNESLEKNEIIKEFMIKKEAVIVTNRSYR